MVQTVDPSRSLCGAKSQRMRQYGRKTTTVTVECRRDSTADGRDETLYIERAEQHGPLTDQRLLHVPARPTQHRAPPDEPTVGIPHGLGWRLVEYIELTDKCSRLRGPPRAAGCFSHTIRDIKHYVD
eukprot:COSAG02_NODE_1372_length_13018_cov_5.358155_2_plen_127_part_00